MAQVKLSCQAVIANKEKIRLTRNAQRFNLHEIGGNMNKLQIVLNNLGHSKVAAACGVKRQAVFQWFGKGCLPKTEFWPTSEVGHTRYANTIAKLAKIKKEELL